METFAPATGLTEAGSYDVIMRTRQLVVAGLLATAVSAIGGGAGQGDHRVDPRWLERLEAQDRSCLDRLIGYAPPPFGEDRAALTWKT